MSGKDEKYSKEFIKEADENEVDEYPLPDWWDESLDEDKQKEK
jgi:hypothetical protein